MLLRSASIALAASLIALAPIDASAAAKPGTVTINCPVLGATILVNGEEVGTVPMDPFSLKFGNHVIRVVRPGLIAFEQKIMLRPDEDLVVNAIPKEPRALITVLTNERGGEVILDGKVIGPLPVREFSTTPGNHSVFIRKEGLQPYKESFLIGPHREYTMKPALKNRDGSPAGGLASLDLDDDLDLAPAKPAPKKPTAGLDLDLDDPPLAKAPPPKASALASLDLGDDLDLEPTAPSAKPAAPTADPVFGTLPGGKVAAATPGKPGTAAKPPPAPPKVAKKDPPKAAPPKAAPPPPSFVTDPIAEEQASGDLTETQPFYTNRWFLGAAGTAVVVAVAIPLLTAGRYVEQRNPDIVCRGCLAVINEK